MSNVSGVHDVNFYTPKSKPLTDQRLSVITFKSPTAKTDKDSPDYDPNYKRPEARCVSVPRFNISVTPQVLQAALQDAYEDLQDALIRKLVVAALDVGKNVITIMDAEINCDAIAEYAKLEAATGKLNRELINDWFDEDVGNELTLALATAMKYDASTPNPEMEKKLANAVTSYKTLFSSLAAPKAGLSPKIAAQMQKALAVAANKEARVYKALEAKIKMNLEAKDPELIGL